MLINGSQAPDFFGLTQPFVLTGERWELNLASTFSTLGGILDIAALGIVTAHLNTKCVTEPKLNDGCVSARCIGFTAADIYMGGDSIEQAIADRLRKDGTTPLTGDWDVNSHKITGLLEPTVDSGAATKYYVDDRVTIGEYWRAPGYSNQLRPSWIRACAAYYVEANPNPGDQVTVHGVTFTFVSGAPVNPDEIEIGITPAISAVNAQAAMNASTTLTLDGIPFNTQFKSELHNTYYLVFIVLNEELPLNNPEDGNDKTIFTACTAIKLVYSFRGGKTLNYFYTGTRIYLIDSAVEKAYVHNTGWL